MRATATIARGTDRTDVAVPPGTTIAGLLAMLHIDTSDADLRVALPDGRRAELGSVIGGDLPSGVLLAVTGAEATEAARTQAVRDNDEAWGRIFAVSAAALLSVALGALLVAPFAGAPTSLAVRVVAGVITAALALTLALDSRLLAGPAGAVLAPALFGLPAVAAIDPTGPAAASLAVAAALVTAGLASIAAWLWSRHPCAAAAAALWGSLALVVGVGMLLRAGVGTLAPLLAVAGVLAVRLAPRYALPIPETQLLDLPLLATAAATVRAPDVAPPSRITRRRVAHTVDYASAVTDTCTLGGALVVVTTGPIVAWLADPTTMTGQAALATLAAAAGGLSLMPRGHRSRIVRTVPRAAASVLVATVAGILAWRGLVAPELVAAALAGVGCVLAFGAVGATKQPPSALLGRAADLTQALALLLLIPGSLLASGLFDLIKEMAQ